MRNKQQSAIEKQKQQKGYAEWSQAEDHQVIKSQISYL